MKVKREELCKLVTVTISKEWEGDCDYETQFDDVETREWVRDQLTVGNEWAWCAVTVTAKFHGLEARDHLGACSYESETAFKNGGYYEDMVNMCCKEIAETIEAMVNTHGLFDHDAASCLWCVAA